MLKNKFLKGILSLSFLFVLFCEGNSNLTVVTTPLTDSEIVNLDAVALEIGYNGNDLASSVTGNLILSTTGENGSAIIWSSDSPSVVTDNGIVTRPIFGNGNSNVILTALVIKGSESIELTFNIIVIEAAKTDQVAVDEDAFVLNIILSQGDTLTTITNNITLPLEGSSGTTISWSSDNINIVSNSGIVNRPQFSQGNIDIILIAIISKGNSSLNKTFNFKVLYLPDTTLPTISILNISNNSIIETAFIYGNVSDNDLVASVEIKIDSGSWQSLSFSNTWRYQLPSGTNSWVDNSIHTVNVRSIDASGNISNIITLNVIKGKNKDINGDGYADLVVGAPYYNNMGRLYIYYGSSNGIFASSSTQADSIIEANITGNFGFSISQGDVNGDGYSDIVSGTINKGKVYLFISSGINGITASSITEANLSLSGATCYGRSLLLSDLNKDGYEDLIIGDYVSNRVYIFESQGTTGITSTVADTYINGTSSTWFGYNIASGDINGDSYNDLIIGASDYTITEGRVYVFHSGVNGILATSDSHANTTITGEANIPFGNTLSINDINRDGYNDLAVGAGKNISGTLKVYIFKSSGSLGITATLASNANTIISWDNAFGKKVYLKDMNRDTYADLVVMEYGIITIFYSNSNDILGSLQSHANQNISNFGLSIEGLSLTDLNGDGYSDISVGAWPNVLLYDGMTIQGIPTLSNLDNYNTIIGITGEYFGFSAGF